MRSAALASHRYFHVINQPDGMSNDPVAMTASVRVDSGWVFFDMKGAAPRSLAKR
jgi:hypothetical protein